MKGFRWFEVSVGLGELRSGTPLGWHVKVGGETCLVVGPKWEGCQREKQPSLDRIDIDLLGRLVMEGRVWDWMGCGQTCPKKYGNDRILRRQVLPTLAWPSQVVSKQTVNVLGITKRTIDDPKGMKQTIYILGI